jgi:hypothetical protein
MEDIGSEHLEGQPAVRPKVIQIIIKPSVTVEDFTPESLSYWQGGCNGTEKNRCSGWKPSQGITQSQNGKGAD